ncbi:hypothetical protein Syun_004459 [Stephania yunnanensis]|uniref:DUF676 domain-containing protein n=1 Tax=Stephania yunnanensis TaxID=152371 RepID=A0AAP0L326_9MAGN
MESSEPQIGSAMVDDGSKQDVLSNGLTENGLVEKESSETKTTKKMKNKKKKSQRSFVPKIGCLRFSDDYPTGYGSDGGFTVEVDPASTKDHRVPTHLVVTVNGIVGRAGNWRFAAKKLLEKYPQDVIVHCSECNSSMLTLDGIDVMGERLAEEVHGDSLVKLVIKSRPELQKISFVSHSLGGLVARYAIAKLYGKSQLGESSEENRECRSEESGKTGITRPDEKSKGKLAGLEPQNFITFATPHLGSRGHKQAPLFCSLPFVEKAARFISWMLGRTGRQLILADNDSGKPPLLVQMVNDSGDLQFLSALQSFRRRVAYSNVRFDALVGWKTSSIRRQHELPKRHDLSKNDKYPHIVNVEGPKIGNSEREVVLEVNAKGYRTNDMEEAMIRGLTRVSWERVDVSFRSFQRFFAHSTIQVKTYFMNSDGTDVVLHMIDNLLL